MFNIDGIDHLMRDISLVLSVTFAIPMIGAVAGAIAANLESLRAWTKGTGRQNG